MVMPTYNQAQWLPGALASVELAARAWHRDLTHVVVVDDGSSDATPRLIGAHSLIYSFGHMRQPNRGSAEAINMGVAQLCDPCPDPVDALAWVSSDNTMTRDWLWRLVGALDDGAGAAYGGFYRVDAERCSYHFTPHEKDRLISGLECYYGPAFLIRKDVWLEAGPHRGRISHDYDHWLRVEEVCYRRGLPIVGVDQPLCWYNAHDKRAGVVKRHEFDAHHWQAEAKKRRGLA